MWEAITADDAEIITVMFHNSVQHYQHITNKLAHGIPNLNLKPKTINLRPLDFLTNDILDVRKLLDSIRQLCDTYPDKKTCLVIDDISYVFLLSSLQNCIHLGRFCTTLLSEYSYLKIIIGNHVTSDDEELTVISRFFQHISKLTISLIPLQSGFSTEVTGHLRIMNKQKIKHHVNKYHYKLEDKKLSINPYII